MKVCQIPIWRAAQYPQEGAIIRTVPVHCVCGGTYANEHPGFSPDAHLLFRCWINGSFRILPPGGAAFVVSGSRSDILFRHGRYLAVDGRAEYL